MLRSTKHEDNTSTYIPILPRQNEFSDQTWWMVDFHQSNFQSSRQGATALLARCMRVYGWDYSKGRKILDSYRQFLILKKTYQDWDASVLTPCALVDQMWQQHILDAVHYSHDMVLLCGHFVGRDPDESLDIQGKEQKLNVTREAMKEAFAEKYDKEIWEITIDLEQGEKTKSETVVKEEEEEEEEEEDEKNEKDQRKMDHKTRKRRSDPEFSTTSKKPKKDQEADEARSNEPLSKRKEWKKARLIMKATNAITNVEEFTHTIEFDESMQMGKVLNWYKNKIFPNEQFWLIRICRKTSELTPSKTGLDLKLRQNELISVKVCSLAQKLETIDFRIRNEVGNETFFKMKRNIKVSRVFDHYAKRQNLEAVNFQFSFDGIILKGSETPLTLGLANDGWIDCARV